MEFMTFLVMTAGSLVLRDSFIKTPGCSSECFEKKPKRFQTLALWVYPHHFYRGIPFLPWVTGKLALELEEAKPKENAHL